ncbi:MAG TPA: fumarylacetoacetate hydrolase family protein [Verrucomicrobiae bacterium]|nr:fumarylacetoacetate hydrolase family protein [Verrucomicrobiae bacterium]
MKLFTFEVNRQLRLGAELNGQLVDLTAARSALVQVRGPTPDDSQALPSDVLAFIRTGEPALAAARETLEFMARRPAVPVGQQLVYAFDAVKLQAPIPRPGKILCSGINYRSHAEENPGAKMPTEPFFFSKLPTAVIGPGESIVLPKASRQVDYEVEFAVVIGRKMKNTPESDVMSHVFGYTILHDVSARDVQFKDNQITLGKNFDTFCPLGPCVVTADQLTNPGNVKLRSFVNRRLMQDGTTADWVFPLPRLLSFLSGVMTLEPGDVVSTGTPAGVGAFRKPPVFLKPGDVCRLEIEGIGVLENQVIEN